MSNDQKFVSLGEHLPLWQFDENFLVFDDGSLGAGFSLKGLDISTATNEVINGAVSSVVNLLNSLDEGCKLQFHYKISPDVSSVIADHERQVVDVSDDVRPVIDSRLSFLKHNMELGNFYQQEIYLFVRSRGFAYKRPGFFAKKIKFSQILDVDFKKHRDNFQKTVSQVGEHLGSMQVSAKALSSKEWYKLIFEYFNFERSMTTGVPAMHIENDGLHESLVEQLILSDFFIQQDALYSGDTYFKVINLGLMPQSTVAAMSERLSKMAFHYWINQTIEIGSQKKEIEMLQLKRRMAHSMAAGAKNVSDLESESKLTNLEGLLAELIGGNEKVLTMGLSLIIWDKDNAELRRKTDLVLRELRAMNQMEGIAETLANFDSFIKSWPGSCESYRSKKVKTSNASHLLPIFANWSGNDRPVCLFPTKDFTPFAIDPFAPELPNWNGLVIGGSGSGKSFTLGQIMLQFATQSPAPKIVFVDNGRSSENLVRVFGGEFIDVSISSGICLNPFELSKDEKTPSTLKIKSILAVLELIFKDEQKDFLPKREKALLEECVTRLYGICKSTPTLSDLKNMLDRHQDGTLKKYGDILFSWTGDSAFGKILDGQSNISLQKNVTAIEVKGLDDFPDLKDVFMLLITGFVQREAESDLSSPYVLVCDEAHRLFKTPSTRDYILYCYRVFRKYNCSIFCITQNHKDFLSIPEVADAIFPNTTHVFILRQRKIDWEDFQKTFDFNEAEINAIKNLRIKKREFSEVFYMQDERRAILKIIPDPLSYWICTSDGSDKAKIEEMKRSHPDLSLVEVLQKLSDESADA
ncbi:MAG: ATP-binding protein [Bacteriovoracaceae bacterium]|nr:ATP-binding protein [Bacteriovoracaceae bacterium]